MDDTLLSKIADNFPELAWQEYQYIDEGWDHQVIILDKRVVFRFPTDEYTSKLRLEMEVLDQLQSQVPAAIPKYIYRPPSHEFGGYALIPGTNLAKSYFDTLNQDEVSTLSRKLAGFLSAMHAQPIAKHPFDQLERDVLKDDQLEVKQGVQEYLTTVLSDSELNIVNDILREVEGMASRELPEAFIHNDVYSRHLFWDADKRQLGVIDFSDMGIGDPAIDFAELHEYGFAFVHAVYEQYTGPKDETFLDRAWTYQKWIGVYMMVDHFIHHKTSFAVARETFDRVVRQQQSCSD
jgi:aminoglycoside phosphotransferase (APT) family kinase protein